MRAVRFHEFGGPEVLVVDEIPRPTPGEDGVLVEVRAIGVNPTDTYIRSHGGESTKRTLELPRIPGVDFAGVVRSVGDAVSEYSVGDRVFGTKLYYDRIGPSGNYVLDNQTGTYAEYVIETTEHVTRLPDEVSFQQGAAVAGVGLTAWQALFNAGDLGPRETCLVHGGSGGVGHVVVQLADMVEAEVIATAGTEEKRQWVRDLGADVVFDYHQPDFVSAFEDHAGTPPDLVIEQHVGEYLQADLDVAAFEGRIVVVGHPLDTVAFDNLTTGMHKDVTIKITSARHARDPGSILADLAGLVRDGTLHVEIAREYDLEEASDAQRAVIDGDFVGKIVLKP